MNIYRGGFLSFFLLSTIAVAEDLPFQTMMVALSEGGAVTAKCNTKTGEGWYSLGERWVKGNDSGQLPPGRYSCQAVAFKAKGWRFMRVDENSGDAWILVKEHWQKIL